MKTITQQRYPHFVPFSKISNVSPQTIREARYWAWMTFDTNAVNLFVYDYFEGSGIAFSKESDMMTYLLRWT